MISQHKTLIVLGAWAGLAGACSDDDEVDASTAQAAMSALVSSVDTAVADYPGDGEHSTLKLDCAGGGTADVEGHVSVAVDPVAVDVGLAIAYDDCATRSGTTLNGSLDFKQSVLAGQVPTRVETVYQGDIVFTGDVEADCAVDVKVLVDEAGKTVKVSGSFCGNDAADLDIVVKPRWER
jgi:hypothetical protein